MPSIDVYLDQICGRLAVNPAVAENIREELRSHLEEAIATYEAIGASPTEATEHAVARFGQSARLFAYLDEVHRRECRWALRLKGAAAGLLFGCLLGLLLPFVRRLGLFSPLFSAAPEGPRVLPLLNGALMGAFIGSLAITRGGLVVGWLLGSLVWLVECTVSWVTGTMTDSYLPTQSMTVFDGLLLSPVIGGFFSAAVGLSSAALVSLTSRPRAQIR
jgi:hypothetical protein